MNELQYRLNSYVYKIKNNDNFNVDEYVTSCYEKFIEKTKGWPISVTQEELEIIIRQIYDVLKLSLSKDEIMKSIDCYLHFLSFTVTISQINIDKAWCIEKIIYLTWNNSSEVTRKMQDFIPFIKERLYNMFQIKKECKTKVKAIKMFSRSYE